MPGQGLTETLRISVFLNIRFCVYRVHNIHYLNVPELQLEWKNYCPVSAVLHGDGMGIQVRHKYIVLKIYRHLDRLLKKSVMLMVLVSEFLGIHIVIVIVGGLEMYGLKLI